MAALIHKMTEEFSKGNFDSTYNYFDENIEWNIVGDKIVKGKKNVIEYCDKMTKEMDGSQLNNTNSVIGLNSMAIEGFCNYRNKENKPSQIQYCDVYLLENEKIKRINSYCITTLIKD